jgi:hypothetical protein
MEFGAQQKVLIKKLLTTAVSIVFPNFNYVTRAGAAARRLQRARQPIRGRASRSATVELAQNNASPGARRHAPGNGGVREDPSGCLVDKTASLSTRPSQIRERGINRIRDFPLRGSLFPCCTTVKRMKNRLIQACSNDVSNS